MMVSTKWQRQHENQWAWQETIEREREAELWEHRGRGAIFDEPLLLSYPEWLNTWWGAALASLGSEEHVKEVYRRYLASSILEIAKNGGPKIREHDKANEKARDAHLADVTLMLGHLAASKAAAQRQPTTSVGPSCADRMLTADLSWPSPPLAPLEPPPSPEPGAEPSDVRKQLSAHSVDLMALAHSVNKRRRLVTPIPPEGVPSLADL
jgi:hypothetical protein